MTNAQALRRLLTYALDEAKSLDQKEVARLLTHALAELSGKGDLSGKGKDLRDGGGIDDLSSPHGASGYLQ